jgi:hypothetical protein
MLKKIFLLTLVTCVSTTTFGMSSIPELQEQLDHIQTQMLSMKRAWNIARVRVKMAQKTSPTLFSATNASIENIISNNTFSTKLDEMVTEQFDAITTNNMSFASTKKPLNISDFFPNATLNSFAKTLFSAAIEKEYYLRLGRKLAQKMQEIEMTINSAQQTTYY